MADQLCRVRLYWILSGVLRRAVIPGLEDQFVVALRPQRPEQRNQPSLQRTAVLPVEPVVVAFELNCRGLRYCKRSTTANILRLPESRIEVFSPIRMDLI